VPIPLSLTEALQALANGSISSAELTREVIATADAHDAQLGVFVSRFEDEALKAAQAADVARAAGDRRPLLGIPIGIKDIISTVEGETTAQSAVHDRSQLSGDAPAVQRLRDAGAVIVGKTTTLEFAFGAPDMDTPFPIPRNPWRLDRWAGGSSSGSGAGVASGMMLGSLGTDTGASVRMPAALCGISGMKPTFGLVPKAGCVPLGFTLDHVGPMARTAEDCSVMLTVLAGWDPEDVSSSAHVMTPKLALAVDRLDGLRVGVDTLSRFAGSAEDAALPSLFAESVDTLRTAGATVVEVNLPYYREVAAAAVITILSEGLTYHLPDLQTRWADYGSSARIGFASGAFATAVDYVQAQRVRRVAQRAVAELFEGVDLILTPTVSRPAPLITKIDAYLGTLFEGREFAHHTSYWDAVGNPALSVPIGFSNDGLPLAAQIIGRPFEDATVLHVGSAYQRATDWHTRLPKFAAGGPDESSAEVPACSTEHSVARSLLGLLGIEPALADTAAVHQALAAVRHNADLLHGVAGARYEDPILTFAP
jgi:aspartyl-tRNA(Asn)/glutamyl-tRNA(Gln) amidotransferase subunit A